MRWRRDGRELFYARDGELFGVPVQTEPDFRLGAPSRLFSNPAFHKPYADAHYDVAPDGERFLVPKRLGGERKIHVFQNWFAAFRK